MNGAKRIARDGAYHVLRLSGVLSRRIRARNRSGSGTAAILVFHGVTSAAPEDGVTITPRRFRDILGALRRWYEPLTLTELLARLRAGRPFTGREVCVTFDDGYLNNYEHAVPLLQDFAIPACFFLTAGYVGTDRTFWWDDEKGVASPMMSWSQAREIAEAGFEIGCHTWSHPDLGTEPVASAPRELGEARDRIEQETGHAVRHFAYPYGGAANIQPEWLDAIREAGYASCCSAIEGHATLASDPFMLPRVGASPQRSVTGLRIDIDGPW